MTSESAELLDFLKSGEVQQFIRKNEHIDPSSLILNPPESISGFEKEVAEQIQSRKKGKNKLPDRFNQEGYIWPSPLSVEQSSSEKAAAYKATLLNGNLLVDLTGGMGVDAIALSGNFDHAIYIEQNEWLCRIFDFNQSTPDTQVEVRNEQAEDFLSSFQDVATFYVDPARRDEYSKKVFRFEDCTPDLTTLLPSMLDQAERILIKASPLIDIKQGIKDLESVKAIHILSISNECKEVLFLLEPGFKGEPKVHCVNLQKGRESKFTFNYSEENDMSVDYGDLDAHVLIPNTSILKAGGFKSVTRDFPIKKVAPNTHLYTSNGKVSDFPGRQFKVIHTGTAKELAQSIPNGEAHVITRNYPLSAEQLAGKLKLKQAGNLYVIGFRDRLAKNQIVWLK